MHLKNQWSLNSGVFRCKNCALCDASTKFTVIFYGGRVKWGGGGANEVLLVEVGHAKFNKLPTAWVTQLWYLHKHTMRVLKWRLVLSKRNVTLCPKICFRKCSHFSPRDGKIQKIIWGRTPPDPLQVHTMPHQTFYHKQQSVIFSNSVWYCPFFVDAPP